MRRANISPQMMKEKFKYEAADELGLLGRVLEGGWGALTSEETGRIGGIVGGRDFGQFFGSGHSLDIQ